MVGSIILNMVGSIILDNCGGNLRLSFGYGGSLNTSYALSVSPRAA